MRDDFAVFITSYKRANNITTINSLKKSGYTGDWYVIIEDNDPEIELYKKNVPKDKLLIYNKKEQAKYYDSCDNFHILDVHTNSISVVPYFVKLLGYKYYYMAEDDFEGFYYKKLNGKKVEYKLILNIDEIFNMCIDFLNCSDKIVSISFKHINTINSITSSEYFDNSTFSYYGYNGFILDVDKPVKFNGTVCEDVFIHMNSYKQGLLTFTINPIKNLHVFYFDKKPKDRDNSGNNYVNSNFLNRELYFLYVLLTFPNMVNLKIKNDTVLDFTYMQQHKSIPKIIDERWKKCTYINAEPIFKEHFIDDSDSRDELQKLIDLVYYKKEIPLENFYEKTVNIDDIIIIQNYLFKESLDSLLNNETYRIHTGSKYTDIYGFKLYNSNKIILADGHHRLAYKIINNEKTVNIKIYDVPSNHFKNIQKILGVDDV